MSDLGKLLDEGDEFERSLLDAGINPAEDREREERTLAALGLGGPVGPGPGDAGGGAALGKWLALVGAGGALVAGAIALSPKPEPKEARPSSTIEAPVVIAKSAPRAEPEPVASEAPPVASVRRPVVPKRVPSASATPAPTSESGLAAEILALDRARSALRAGDTQRARDELDRYDRKFPFGALGPEANALRARVNKIDADRKKP